MRQLQYSQFQDWENYLYVEPRILSEAAEWMCLFQNEDGSFSETVWYECPLDQKMDPRSRVPGERHRERRIPLTAHVLITLHAVQAKLQGGAKGLVATAKALAMRYLERSLHVLVDPYEIALTAYALTLINSVDRELAFSRLVGARREVEGMYYWAREPVPTLSVSRDVNQRTYLQGKSEQVWDAQSVEATSYALLVYLHRDGVGIDQEKMVLWLNSMRMCNAGFISTVVSDTETRCSCAVRLKAGNVQTGLNLRAKMQTGFFCTVTLVQDVCQMAVGTQIGGHFVDSVTGVKNVNKSNNLRYLACTHVKLAKKIRLSKCVFVCDCIPTLHE